MKKIFLFVLGACLVTFLQFCHSSKNATGASKVSYTSRVQPIIQANCSPCHFPPQGRSKPLNSYVAAKTNIDTILARIQRNPGEKGFMPQRHPKLPDSTIQVFKRWKQTGLAEM